MAMCNGEGYINPSSHLGSSLLQCRHLNISSKPSDDALMVGAFSGLLFERQAPHGHGTLLSPVAASRKEHVVWSVEREIKTEEYWIHGRRRRKATIYMKDTNAFGKRCMTATLNCIKRHTGALMSFGPSAQLSVRITEGPGSSPRPVRRTKASCSSRICLETGSRDSKALSSASTSISTLSTLLDTG